MNINIMTLRRATPRWVIFTIDLVIVFISIIAAYYLRFNFTIPSKDIDRLPLVIISVLIIRALFFLIGKTYAGMVRFTGSQDIIRILVFQFCSSACFIVLNIIYLQVFGKYLIPTSVIIIDYIISAFILSFSRLLVKNIYLEFSTLKRNSDSVLIYGTGELAQITKKTIERNTKSKLRVFAFVDHRSKIYGKRIDGTKVYHLTSLKYILENKKIKTLIIAEKSIPITRKKFIVELCLKHEVEVKIIPDVNLWINGKLSFNKLENIKIEDLLERSVINMDKEGIHKNIFNKTIFVSGAAGSIGSEIVRQLTHFMPKMIILLDNAETPLYNVELELKENFNYYNFKIVVGSICDELLIDQIFSKYKIDYVYHAAAYKHVPIMEENPSAAVVTNVFGTKIIADAAIKHNARKFVMISTDKAVNPTNVMGASKRIAEIYIQSLSNKAETKFVTTRFGNVLGSNGSVIPYFRKQIENGGPVTVTHPEITRFFMTIPEACQLVLEAGNMGKGGEIFIFDMGKPVKIINLAKKMILLSGLKPEEDIQIKYIGLRPGEKLYEELLANKENTIPTYHSQIMIAKVRKYDQETVSSYMALLFESYRTGSDLDVVRAMKQVVPEFISNNSVFDVLDN